MAVKTIPHGHVCQPFEQVSGVRLVSWDRGRVFIELKLWQACWKWRRRYRDSKRRRKFRWNSVLISWWRLLAAIQRVKEVKPSILRAIKSWTLNTLTYPTIATQRGDNQTNSFRNSLDKWTITLNTDCIERSRITKFTTPPSWRAPSRCYKQPL